jgi:6-methylsalicylate decarboxylase
VSRLDTCRNSVHHHSLPDVFWRATNDAHNPVDGKTPAPWSKESTLSFMDDAGIDVAITPISTPGIQIGNDKAARDLARRVNEIGAQLIQDRTERFGGFAALPLPDVEGALRELEYRLDVLKLDCVVLFSNARGIYLGDACVRPLFAELERHAVVVFVHPTASPDAAARTLGLPDSLIDFTTDTTRAVAQLHYGDTFAAYAERQLHLFTRGRDHSLFGNAIFDCRRHACYPRGRGAWGRASPALLGHSLSWHAPNLI